MTTDIQNSVTPRQRPPWQLVVVAFMGWYWAVSFLIVAFTSRGSVAPMGWLPLLGFLAPVLCSSPRRGRRRLAFWLCVFEVCLSPLMWWGSMMQIMDPVGFRLRVLGIPVTTIWSAGGQFVYFAVRGLLFAVAAVFISRAPPITIDETCAV